MDAGRLLRVGYLPEAPRPCALLYALVLFGLIGCAPGVVTRTERSSEAIQTPPSLQLKMIASDEFAGTDAAISRDGRYIIVSSRRGGGASFKLWLYDTEHRLWRDLGDAPGDQLEPQFS